ncbi:hypothetical protein [Mariniblastus fucicola]|nr:hypothetical protein [Mariniblastus fucicola]
MSTLYEIDNPVGLGIYLAICMSSLPILMPLLAFGIAPALCGLSNGSVSMATIIHGLLLVVGSALIWFLPDLIKLNPSLGWMLLLYYCALFLFPPSLAASFAYSIVYNSTRKTQARLDAG